MTTISNRGKIEPLLHKDFSDIANTIPVSPINCDLKDPHKNSFLQNYIHTDQTGFIHYCKAPNQISSSLSIPTGTPQPLEKLQLA